MFSESPLYFSILSINILLSREAYMIISEMKRANWFLSDGYSEAVLL